MHATPVSWHYNGSAVLPAVVLVSLPVEATAAETGAFIEACSEAYVGGDCAAGTREPAGAIQARVTWRGETEAEISVVYPARTTERSAYRSLEFQSADDSNERYKALGFAVGSMAGSIAEAEERAGTAPPSPTAEPAAPVATTEPKPTPPPEPAAPLDSYDPPDPLPALPSVPPPAFEDLYRVGVHAGSGIEATRWGASLGARAAWSRRWMLDLAVGYSAQSTNEDGIGATFAAAAFSAGVELGMGNFVLGVGAGPGLQLQWAERAESNTHAFGHGFGVDGALHLRYGVGAVCPFVEVRGGWYREMRVLLSDSEQLVYGPRQVQLSLGIALSRSAALSADD